VVRTLQTDIGTRDMVKMGWLQARLKQGKGDRILLTGEPQLIDGVSFVVQTDIGTMDMVKMGWLQARLKQQNGDRTLLTGSPEYIDGVAYVVQTDPDLNEREIARFVASD
jgi:hypothetical protein